MKTVFVTFMFIIMFSLVGFDCCASSGGIPISSQQKQAEVAPQTKPAEPKKIPQAKPEDTLKPAQPQSVQPQAVQSQAVQPKPKPALSREQKLELERKRALVAKKKEALNNTEWEVVMNPLSGKGKKVEDTIIFSEGKVSLKELNEQGFPATNYTLTLQEDNKVVWETMQTADKEVVFFRGEVSPDMDNMNGIASFQRLEGNQDYNFASIKKRQLISTE